MTATDTRPDHRLAAVPGYRDLLALASLMLGYPDESLCAARAGLAQALAGVPESTGKDWLVDFTTWWVDADPGALQREYVDTFDTRRGSALYVTYAGFGDARTRGSALLEMKQLYFKGGWRPSDDELPDYLPTVCQFAALAAAADGWTALALARDGVEAIHTSLVTRHSNYRHVLAAIEWIIEKGGRS